MRGRVARRLRREAFGDRSRRERSYGVLLRNEKAERVMHHPESPMAAYRRLKAQHKDGRE